MGGWCGKVEILLSGFNVVEVAAVRSSLHKSKNVDSGHEIRKTELLAFWILTGQLVASNQISLTFGTFAGKRSLSKVSSTVLLFIVDTTLNNRPRTEG